MLRTRLGFDDHCVARHVEKLRRISLYSTLVCDGEWAHNNT